MPDVKVLNFVDRMAQPRADLDIPLDSRGLFAGDPVFLSGTDKIVQDVVKGVLTIINTNDLAPGYGTNLGLLRKSAVGDIVNQMTNEIQQLLGYLGEFNVDEPLSEQVVELIELQVRQNIGTMEVQMSLRTGTGATTTVVV